MFCTASCTCSQKLKRGKKITILLNFRTEKTRGLSFFSPNKYNDGKLNIKSTDHLKIVKNAILQTIRHHVWNHDGYNIILKRLGVVGSNIKNSFDIDTINNCSYSQSSYTSTQIKLRQLWLSGQHTDPQLKCTSSLVLRLNTFHHERSHSPYQNI